MAHILVVDDDRSMREFLEYLFRKAGHQVTVNASGDEALATVAKTPPDLVVQDLKMPGMPGRELISRLKAIDPDRPIIVITAFSTWDNAVEAMRLGAHDYIKKPFDNDEIRDVVERALSRRRILAEARGKPDLPEFHAMIGNSAPMREALDIVRRVAPAESTILIQGESGTGKELIARMIHYWSPRAASPFISVNCGAFPESLLESELFGHLRGTFTGAHADKKGLFQVADGGTFFMDEVGEIPHTTQVKLLRVLEERQFYPLGGTKPVRIDVRFVCATNRDLAEEVRRGNFRGDLFFRLNVIPITLPPLRAREGDIPLLAGFFMRKYAKALGREMIGIAPDAQRKLEAYRWPGNVRELENAIQRSIALARGNVIEDFMLADAGSAAFRGESLGRAPAHAEPPATAGRAAPAHDENDDSGAIIAPLTGLPAPPPLPPIPASGFDLEAQLASIERRYIEEALARSGGNLTRAADVLGISFRSIRYKVKKLGIRGTGASQRIDRVEP